MKANFSHQLRRDLGQKVDLTLEVDPLASSSLSSSAGLGRVKTSIVDSGEEFPCLFTGCSFSVLADCGGLEGNRPPGGKSETRLGLHA